MGLQTKEKIFYGWVIVAAALVIVLVLVGIRFSFGVFFKSLEADFELTRAATSSVFSAYMVLAGVFGIVNGWALDKYGPKRIISLMGLFTGLGLVITGLTSLWWQLFLSYSLLVAIGTAGAVPLLMSIVSRWFDKKRGIAIGVATSGTGLGTIVLAPLAAYLISSLDWRMSYIVVGSIACLLVISMAMLLRSDPREMGSLPDGVRLSGHRAEPVDREEDFHQLGLSLGQALGTRSFWLLLTIWLLFALCLGLVMTHVVPYATDLDISTIEASTVLSVMAGFQILARLLVGRITDIVGRKMPGLICVLIGTGAMIWLIWSHNLWMFYLFAIGFGICYGGFAVVNLVMVSDSFGGRNLGVMMGVMNAGYSVGLAIGSALGGFTFDVTHSYAVAFGIGAAVMLINGLLIIFVRRETGISLC